MLVVMQKGVTVIILCTIFLHFRFIFEYFTLAFTLSENYDTANIS